ncbi:hypothetical protein L198_00406 [Cryptococcus wingfieldii CBS 7118]|uniref:Uncharacterized protein n=1 Tax=Cryptococcus wingfieldii CBS 7118 TaxID=1295528 RepID=A0A1E3K667_9TREE|nr:hypothetical protein L198_00406 [Cryptococcus wingfieldii CBS 7118]ODO08674.1 hypothetical protein L198_00406 [Cryptococcus wingfieldii CBS 7118]
MAQSRCYDANDTLEYIIGDDGEEYEYEGEAPDLSMGSHPTYPPRLSSRGIDPGSFSASHPTQTGLPEDTPLQASFNHSTPGPHHIPTGVSHNNYMDVRIEERFTYRESYHSTEMSVADGFFTSAVQSQSGSGGPLITTKNHVDYTKPEYDWESQPLPSPASTTGGSAGKSSKALKKKKSLLSLFGK